MRRRSFVISLIGTPALLAVETRPGSIRGKLRQTEPVVLEVSGGRRVTLSGDDSTMAVLRDERIRDTDFEALGKEIPPDGFRIEGIHTRSMFVHRDGKRLMVTYWCDVCYIRTYTPGKCWCCQKYTDLDLRESLD